jgi:hypothetical protein
LPYAAIGRRCVAALQILDPYDGLYVRAVCRYDDPRPEETSGVRYQLTEQGRMLGDLETKRAVSAVPDKTPTAL